MVKLKYGQKVYDEIATPIKKSNQQIKELEAEQAKLQKELDKTANNFDVEVIRANQKLEQEMELITTALERAKAHRKELIDGNAYENYKKADKVFFDILRAEKDARADHIEKIENKIKEIHELYDEAKAYDTKVDEGLTEYIQAVSKYLSDSVVAKGGLDTPAERIYSRIRFDRRNGMRVIDYFDESQYKIKGLLPPANRITPNK